MKCPHCLISFHPNSECQELGKDKDWDWFLEKYICPSCNKLILMLEAGDYISGSFISRRQFLVYPRGISRAPLSFDVPEKFAQDYKEACMVLSESPKASAALSRRCLQNVIREIAGIKKSNLNDEIDELLKTKTLPTYLAQSVDAIRNLGNFAAHPTKSTNSGAIVDVESGEAEWGLDVLEGLFDFYFVQPAVLQKKRDELNKKLGDAGKPPMK